MYAINDTLVRRLLVKIDFGPFTDCWPWLGVRNQSGYGYIRIAGRGSARVSATRIVYWLFRGAFDPSHEIDHLCEFPPCVNPWHLEPKAHPQNMYYVRKKNKRTQREEVA